MKAIYVAIGIMLIPVLGTSEEVVLEQLLGVTVDERGISFQVASNGCTTKADFNIIVEERLIEKGPMLPAFEHHFFLGAVRVKEDLCGQTVPYGTIIFKSFEELGIEYGKFHITNPIGGDKVTVSR